MVILITIFVTSLIYISCHKSVSDVSQTADDSHTSTDNSTMEATKTDTNSSGDGLTKPTSLSDVHIENIGPTDSEQNGNASS